jgi:hypothetical protein
MRMGEDRIISERNVIDSLGRRLGDIDDVDIGSGVAIRSFDAPPSPPVSAETDYMKRLFEDAASAAGATVEWLCDVRVDRNVPFWYQDDCICRLHSPDYVAELQTTSPIAGFVDGFPYDDGGANPWKVVDDYNIGNDMDAEAEGVTLDCSSDYFYWWIYPQGSFQDQRIYAIDSSDYGMRENTLTSALSDAGVDSGIRSAMSEALEELGGKNAEIDEAAGKGRRRKAPKGATLIKDAGDVEANVAHFNMAMGADATCSEAVDTSSSESLRTATPYMLRNDGKLVECAPMHPYIMRAHELADILKLLKDGDDEKVGALRWFREHTGNDKLRETIDVVLGYFGIEKIDAYKSSDEEILDFVRQANNLSNQEFLRLRTSSMLYGGTDKSLYARISSVDFNWYPLLSDLLLSHPGIENITICKDSNTFGGRFEAYSINGVKCDHLPVDEFLCMGGVPIVEGVRSKYGVVNNAIRVLSDGRSINEAYPNMHPRYLNGWYMTEIAERLEDNLKNSQHPTDYVVDESPEKHQTLNGKLWNIEDNTLKPEVKEKINAIVKDFCDGLDDNEVKYKLADVRLVGSNCSYNYTDRSDLDIHIVFDLGIYDDKEKEQMAETIYNYARNLWGKTHSVKFYDIPVEVFVETNNTVDLNKE